MEVRVLKDEEGLKSYEVVIPMSSITQAVGAEIVERRKTFKLAGFREGAVPLAMVEKQVGPQILQEHVDKRINEAINTIREDYKVNPMGKVEVNVESFDPQKELKFTATFNIAPTFEEVDWKSKKFNDVKIFELDVKKSDIDEMHNTLLEQQENENFIPADDKHKAAMSDAVIIDFVGTIDGKNFEGNKANSLRLVLGSNKFIPGFEDQLVGMKKGDEKVIDVTFPKDYKHSEELAGKKAKFDIKVHEVLQSKGTVSIDDEFAKKNGFESLAALDNAIENKLKLDFARVVRLYTKKKLFDTLDEVLVTKIPQNMVDEDFNAIWKDLENNRKQNPEQFKGKSDDELKAELKKLAERRVKLGLFLSKFASENNIQVGKEELDKLLEFEKAQNPGKAKEVEEFYKNEGNAMKIIGAVLEEKIVDTILKDKLKAPEVKITAEEFQNKYGNELK